jgi:O-methyltransferase involved in polyketide biosynthesis
MPSDYEALRAEAEERLIDFLVGEIQTGVRWAEMALIAKDTGDADNYVKAKESAEKVAKTVQRFMDLVQNGQARREIAKRLAELERLLSTR